MAEFKLSAEAFDTVFSAIAKSATYSEISVEVYGVEAREAPQYSFTTASELARMGELLRAGPGDTFLDLACGMGGPGLLVAQATGASVVGIDWSAAAIERARGLALARELGARARFLVGDATATGLASSSLEGALSIDALQLFADRRAALHEVARVLRPGARFVFTTWEGKPGSTPARLAVDNAPLLGEVGFRVDERHESLDWILRAREFFTALLERRERIAAECGEASKMFFEEGERILAETAAPPRVLYAATRN
jgi:SAM-dependent methyltransferase